MYIFNGHYVESNTYTFIKIIINIILLNTNQVPIIRFAEDNYHSATSTLSLIYSYISAFLKTVWYYFTDPDYTWPIHSSPSSSSTNPTKRTTSNEINAWRCDAHSTWSRDFKWIISNARISGGNRQLIISYVGTSNDIKNMFDQLPQIKQLSYKTSNTATNFNKLYMLTKVLFWYKST